MTRKIVKLEDQRDWIQLRESDDVLRQLEKNYQTLILIGNDLGEDAEVRRKALVEANNVLKLLFLHYNKEDGPAEVSPVSLFELFGSKTTPEKPQKAAKRPRKAKQG